MRRHFTFHVSFMRRSRQALSSPRSAVTHALLTKCLTALIVPAVNATIADGHAYDNITSRPGQLHDDEEIARVSSYLRAAAIACSSHA